MMQYIKPAVSIGPLTALLDAGDLDGDGEVSVADFLTLLANWS